MIALVGAIRMWKETFGMKGLALVRILIQDQVLYFGMFVPEICLLDKPTN